jgi:hypothetical protein
VLVSVLIDSRTSLGGRRCKREEWRLVPVPVRLFTIRHCKAQMFGQRAVALVVLLCSTTSFVHAQQKKPKDNDYRFTQPLPEWIVPFANDTDALFKYITAGDGRGVAFDWLAEVTDTFGHRQTGSAALEAAIDFNLERLKADGFDNVHTEDVPNLPHWERGDDLAELIGNQ